MKHIYTPIQLREIFHLEFLRWFSRHVDPALFALKGGVNLRFFYKSIRYSEDMDFDIRTISPDTLQRNVMRVLMSDSFRQSLIPFGIESVIPPDIVRSKQTHTTQRFKIHLVTSHGEDFFTKVEFSRRAFADHIAIESVDPAILRTYKVAPVLVPHYTIVQALEQKINALAHRVITQARDVFDISLLYGQMQSEEFAEVRSDAKTIEKAEEAINALSYEHYRDQVILYLEEEDRRIYDTEEAWSDIQKQALTCISAL